MTTLFTLQSTASLDFVHTLATAQTRRCNSHCTADKTQTDVGRGGDGGAVEAAGANSVYV